jgi:hypothetical protein
MMQRTGTAKQKLGDDTAKQKLGDDTANVHLQYKIHPTYSQTMMQER